MKQISHSTRQNGAALVTSLIFLTVLTILGMTSMGTSLLENRMAGNSRDRNLAFQSAEMGLRDAELFIRDSGRVSGNILVESTLVAGDGDYSATGCNSGFCYSGPNWSTSVNDWIANPVWVDPTNNYWQYALQYYRDNTNGGKGVGSALGGTVLAVNAPYSLPGPVPLVSRQPEYLIESFPQKAGDNKFYYRITVRGYGMRAGTRVMLQEVYTP
jgi:type IV pilus assembly protein PilX